MKMPYMHSLAGHSQILSRNRGEYFLQGCEIKSGSGLGTRLLYVVYSHFVNSHFVNSHLVNVDKVGIDEVGSDKVGS